MKSTLNRRSFLKRAALAAGALSTTRFFPGPNILAATGTIDKLNCVQVGCGIRSEEHLSQVIGNLHQNLYAIVVPDPKKQADARNRLKRYNGDPDKLQVFTDYRVMFDKIGKNIDAVFVATPNHQHAKVAMMAMQAGKNVYCEKPLCHDIKEARMLREAARKYSTVATQMGNQGHCDEGYISLCELIWSGAVGNITETHTWSDRANGGSGPRPPTQPPPAGMVWDNWIGPAPYRDYHAEPHPHEWHGWYDFGNGSLGNMGCHTLDGVFWALKVEHPTSMEVEYILGGSDERYPTGTRIRWDVPARAGMPPLKAYWYDGFNATDEAKPSGTFRQGGGRKRNLPALLSELQAKYPGEKLGGDGTLYVGEKGIIYTGTYGEGMHIVPESQPTPKPPRTLPRPKGVFADFVQACRAGSAVTASPFEYGARLTEFIILGNLAQHVGAGKKVEWDGPNMKATNFAELDPWIQRPYRKGWEL